MSEKQSMPDVQFDISVDNDGEPVSVMTLRFDDSDQDRFDVLVDRMRMLRRCGDLDRFVLDCSRLDHIGSSILAMIISVANEDTDGEGLAWLKSGFAIVDAQDRLPGLLSLCKLDELIRSYTSAEEGVRAVRAL